MPPSRLRVAVAGIPSDRHRLVTAALWTPDAPTRCACAGAYRPVLEHGKLVKSREPAWSMAEQTRDPGCLQERIRHLAKVYRVDYQHHKTSRGSGAGYPDVHMWAPGRGSVYAELKRMDRGYPSNCDNPTDVQVRVMGRLQAADEHNLVYLWRPCCVLSGVVDEAIAEFAGVRCLYAGGHPAGSSLAGVLADMAATDPRRKPPAPVAVRPVRRPVLPGADPQPFAPAMGLIVPPPADDAASSAMCDLEDWLRAAGFSPVDVPYPLRLIVGEGALHVQCRVGLARPGRDERVWRGGVPARPLPDRMADALHANQVFGPASDKVAWLIEKMPHSGTVFAEEQSC